MYNLRCKQTRDLRSNVFPGERFKWKASRRLIEFHKAKLHAVLTSLLTGINVTENICSEASLEE